MQKSRTAAVAIISLWLVLFAFQNCSQIDFGAQGDRAPSATSTSPPPDTDKTSYAWVSNGFGACSATCGGGTQIQNVVCQRNDGAAVDDSFCTGTKPPTSQACNIEACASFHWVTSGFSSCSASCGGGTQTQTISCHNQNDAVVDNSLCSQPAPVTSQTCNPQACVTYAWTSGGFGACSKTCGGGTQTQSVTCQSSAGTTVNNSFCTGIAPAGTQACNSQACLTYNWSQSGFGACSATCGGGTQTQTVVCKDSLGNQVNSSLCAAIPQPPATQSCNPQACVTYQWQQSGWSSCSASCGGGIQTQTVTCQANKSTTVANSFCTTQAPPSTQTCNTQACRDPLANFAGGFVFHAGGNTGTITLQRSGNQISGTDNFPNWTDGMQVGITCTDVGSVTATSANAGTISFVRSNCSGQTYQPQNFVGTWSTVDFVHYQMSGQWTWQLPNSYMPGGGPWDASRN